MSQPTSQQPARTTKPAKQERYVDELADSADCWLTFTDAARVTRRQDIVIRRWVYSGALPVRRKPVGLNKRSRQVRLSDLRQLTPIIDLAGAISGAPGRFDLMSIPEQQATILNEHQHLLADHTTLSQAVQTVQQHLADQTEQTRGALDAQFRQVMATVQAFQADYSAQFLQHQETLQAQQQGFHSIITSQMETLKTEVQGLSSELAQETTAHAGVHRLLEPRLTSLESALTTQQQDATTRQQQMEQALATLEQSLLQLRQEVLAWLSQYEETVDQAINRLIEQMQTTQATLEEHMETVRTQAAAQVTALTERLERLETAQAQEHRSLRTQISALQRNKPTRQ